MPIHGNCYTLENSAFQTFGIDRLPQPLKHEQKITVISEYEAGGSVVRIENKLFHFLTLFFRIQIMSVHGNKPKTNVLLLHLNWKVLNYWKELLKFTTSFFVTKFVMCKY